MDEVITDTVWRKTIAVLFSDQIFRWKVTYKVKEAEFNLGKTQSKDSRAEIHQVQFSQFPLSPFLPTYIFLDTIALMITDMAWNVKTCF